MAIDPRARAALQAQPGAAGIYYAGPAVVLRQTNGLVFPLTPAISYNQQVNWSPYDLVHTNYNYQTYRNTPSAAIQITGQFSNTTAEEHNYTVGVLHFLRSVTKMWYGANQTSPAAGTPPPVLVFSAFGPQVFNATKVVVANFATTFDDNVDLVTGPSGNALPAVMTLAIDLMVTRNPKEQKEQFTTSGFVSGSLYSRGFI